MTTTSNSKANLKLTTRNFTKTHAEDDRKLEMVYDCVNKCYWHPHVGQFVFHVQGEFSYDMGVHPSRVAGVQKHLKYLPSIVRALWNKNSVMRTWADSWCTWVQIWDAANERHVTRIHQYGVVLYVEERFLELQERSC